MTITKNDSGAATFNLAVSGEKTYDADNVIQAYEDAEMLTEQGYEVTAPESLDGGFTFTISFSK